MRQEIARRAGALVLELEVLLGAPVFGHSAVVRSVGHFQFLLWGVPAKAVARTEGGSDMRRIHAASIHRTSGVDWVVLYRRRE